ncbi:MAG: ABC transporter ATP-binding protein [Pseudomonadota bacterium]
MALIHVDNVTLVHPVHGQFSPSLQRGDAPTRLVKNAAGKLVGVKALDKISFTLERGSRVGIVGRNGSGKTTLLRVLAGILTPDVGSVTVEGRSTNLININLGTKDDASGHRNITLQGLAHGHSRAEIEARRGDIEAFSDLGAFLDLPVNTYSAGMRMRLSFAIATAFKPEVLLLDEWLSAGDEQFRQKAGERMKSFVAEAGILVLASHSSALLKQNCTSAIWLEEGQVRMEGPVDDVLAAYRDSFGEAQSKSSA